ncbi:MAG: GAF domain-containing protein [Microcoleaceae cyanobacterium]
MSRNNYRVPSQNERRYQRTDRQSFNKIAEENSLTSENTTIIPVEASVSVEGELDSVSNSNQSVMGLKAKTTALSKELSILRANIDTRVNQLQGLIEREGAAAERAKLLNEITSHIRESLEVEDIFKTVTEDARGVLQTDRVVVYQFDTNWQGIVIAESVDPQWPAALGAEITDPCLADRYVEFYQKGRIRAISNIYEAGLTDCYIGQLEPFDAIANLTAPILANGKLLGLLIAHHCGEPRVWSESEIEFFRQLAIQVGYAVDQALLLRSTRDKSEAATRLNQINTELRKSLNLDDILTTGVEETRMALQADRVVVYKFDADWSGTIIAESVVSPWPVALGADITDPCFANRYIQPYLRGRVKATNNIHEAGLTECHLKQLEPFAVKANLVAPILVNQKLMGLLIAHQCSAPRNWSETEIDLIRNVAVQMGYTLDQAYLLESQQAAAFRASFLNEITGKLREARNPEDVYDTIVEGARTALKADRVIIYQFDQDWIGTVMAESIAQGWTPTFGKKIADPCFSGQYVKSYFRGRVTSHEDIYKSGLPECYTKLLEPFEVKANVVAPIIADTRLHGLLIAHQCSAPRKWDASEIDFIQQLGIQVGVSLDQLYLIHQQKQAVLRATQLNQISSHIRESLNPEDIFNATVEDTQEAIEADRVVVYQFDGNWQGTVVAEAVDVGFPQALGAKIADPCFAKNYVRPYLKGRVKATDNIYEAELTECHLKQLEPFEVKANLVAPIIANQKLHGLLIAHQCSGPRHWKEAEIDLIRQVAIQVGYALDQAFLLEQQTFATQQARLLSEISFRIRETLDPKQIFQTTAEAGLALMKTQRVVIYRIHSENDDDPIQAQIVAEASTGKYSPLAETESESFAVDPEAIELYQKGQTQIINDFSTADSLFLHSPQQLEKWQIKAGIMIPILLNQKLYGILAAYECDQTRTWKESEVEVFKQVGLQVGYALEQALLLRQVQQARKLAEKASKEQREQNEQLKQQIETFLAEIEQSFNGDLTVRARVTEGVMGTVADFFNATIENLQRLVLQVDSAATVVTQTAQNSEQDIKQLSSESLRQAEAITSALTQIQVMANSIQAVAENAQQAATKVSLADEILQKGDAGMNRTVEGIVVIHKTVQATARKVRNLGDASKKISRVVSLISEFANQTNVLALNASVEASRASASDQGFATVATEVRTLAEQSATATQEIEQIVEEIQAETQELMKAMEIGMKRVVIGTKLVKGTRETLTDLMEVSHQIRDWVEQIATSATAQAETAGELSETVQEIAAISNETSEQSLIVASSFNRLLGVAGELEAGVSQFRVTQED